MDQLSGGGSDIELYKEQYVLVLSYVDAVSLEEVLAKKKKLSVDEAVNVVEQCCEALVGAEKLIYFIEILIRAIYSCANRIIRSS